MDTTHPGEKGSDHTRSHRPLAPHHAVSQAEDGRKDRTDEILDERELDKPAPKTNLSRISIKADLNPNGFQSNQIANQEFWLEGPRLQSPDAPRERLGTGSRSRGGHCKALYLEKSFLRFLGIDTAAVPLLKNPVSTCQRKVSSAPLGMSSGGDSQESGPGPRSGENRQDGASGGVSGDLFGSKSVPAAFSMRFLQPFRPIHLPDLRAPQKLVRPRGWTDVSHLHGDSYANPHSNLPPAGHGGPAGVVVCVVSQRIGRRCMACRSRDRTPCIRGQPAASARDFHRQLEFVEHESRQDNARQRRSRCSHRGLLRTGVRGCRCERRDHAPPRRFASANRLHPHGH